MVGWGKGSGSEMMLGKFPVTGSPAYLNYRRARAYCAVGGRLDIFFSRLLFFFLPLSGRRPDID